MVLPVLLQAISFSIIYSGYLINKNYISISLCENRTVPEKHCEGKCVLKKEMKAESEKENGSLPVLKKGSELVYYFNESVFLFCHSSSAIGQPVICSDLYFFSFPSGIFHPPRA
jgi:hypothetical protein